MPLPKPAKAPCGTCPYRRDVPSGIWHPDEYAKLPKYDGETFEQLDAPSLFMCHSQPSNLCSGWVGCHDTAHLLALRLHKVDPSTFRYVSPVPLFASGREAADHGRRNVDNPDVKAFRAIKKLEKRREPSNG